MNELTETQRMIVECLLTNPTFTNANIAEALGKPKRTVDNHFRNIYKRLGLQGSSYAKRSQLLVMFSREE